MRRRFPWSLLVVVVLVPLVLVLAMLQYRWTGEVSRVEATRMQSYLLAATGGLREDLGLELDAAAAELTADAALLESGEWASYAEQVAVYRDRERFPGLIGGIHLLQGGENGSWTVRDWSSDRAAFGEAHALAGDLASIADAGLVDGVRAVGERLYIVRPLERAATAIGTRDGRAVFFKELVGSTMCLVLDVDVPLLADTVLPLLVTAHFGASLAEYTVAVVSPSGHAYVYATESDRVPATPDVSLSLFGGLPTRFFMSSGIGMASVRESLPTFASRVEEAASGTQSRTVRTYVLTPRVLGSQMPTSDVLMIAGSTAEEQWLLLAAHRSGSLAAAAAASRRTNLAVSLGILLALAVAVVVLARALGRSRELARRERELVASVSHELKTPLGVIMAVGQNLESGIVAEGARVREYGGAIGVEGARLREMIEKILAFSRVGGGRIGGRRAAGC